MSHFYIFFLTKATVKFANENTGHDQGIGMILCIFTRFTIVYPVVPVYYYPGHPSNKISLVALRFYVGFKKFKSQYLENCDFVDPQYCSWRSLYQTQMF